MINYENLRKHISPILSEWKEEAKRRREQRQNTEAAYYRIYRRAKDDLFTVVCMQWFDENDYQQSRFVCDTESKPISFATEREAQVKLNDWFVLSEIDPEYRIVKVPRY